MFSVGRILPTQGGYRQLVMVSKNVRDNKSNIKKLNTIKKKNVIVLSLCTGTRQRMTHRKMRPSVNFLQRKCGR